MLDNVTKGRAREMTCVFCQSVYTVSSQPLASRELNLADCVVCGSQLVSCYAYERSRFSLKQPAPFRTGSPGRYAARGHER